MSEFTLPMQPHAEGVYFGLDETEYHSAFALSSSGIKWLRCSPLDWWTRSPLNPRLAEVKDDEEDTVAQIVGRAYHRRILEGRERFYECYQPAIDKSAYKDALDTNEEMKAWLRARDLKIGGNKADLIERILDADPTAKIWDAIESGYREIHKGKDFLTPDLIRSIEIAAAMIEKHPQHSKVFSGGMPEVSIFWTCPIIGVPCKARLDYLKPKAVCDLKSFANKFQRPIDSAISRDFVYNGYTTQAVWYQEAAAQVAEFIKAGMVYGDCDKALLQSFAANHDKTFVFLFQQKGVAPLARAKVFRKELNTYQIAHAHAENMKQIFRTNLETFGADPWLDLTPITEWSDEDLPPSYLE